jgi:hypothetical protein
LGRWDYYFMLSNYRFSLEVCKTSIPDIAIRKDLKVNDERGSDPRFQKIDSTKTIGRRVRISLLLSHSSDNSCFWRLFELEAYEFAIWRPSYRRFPIWTFDWLMWTSISVLPRSSNIWQLIHLHNWEDLGVRSRYSFRSLTIRSRFIITTGPGASVICECDGSNIIGAFRANHWNDG